MILNSQTLAALNTSFNKLFKDAFNETKTQYERIATTVPSSSASNTYGWLGTLPSLREWIGDRYIQNIKEHDYTIKNKDFETTVAVKVNDIKDDNLGMYSILIQDLGDCAKRHPDELVFGLLKQGTSLKCYDKQNFFDTDHPVVGVDGKTASVSNYQSGSKPAWFLLCTKRRIKPIIYQKRENYELVIKDDVKDENVFHRKEILYGVDGRGNVGFGLWQLAFCSQAELNQANFEAAYKAMRSFTRDQGIPLDVKPDLLVFGPSNTAAAEALINCERLSNGASNVNYHKVDLLESGLLD